MTPVNDHRQSGGTTGRKAVLYCPECGHESPIDGDWHVATETDGERLVHRCPVCGAAVDTRPRRLAEA